MRAVVSCAFREPYLTHSFNQEKVLLKSKGVNGAVCKEALPYKEGLVTENIIERFQKSLYGFKPHAIQTILDTGCKQIIWLDPSVLPTTDINLMFDELEKTDMLVQTGTDNINDMANDKSIKWFGLDRDNLKDVRHIGGTVYGFNFDNPKTLATFNLWKRAEEEGIFGNQDEFMAGHWADESCLALAMHVNGIEQKFSKTFKFRNQKNG